MSLSAFVPLITFFLSFTPLLFWTLKSVADTSSLIGRCIGHLFSFDDCHHNNSGAKTVYKVSTNDQSHSQIVGPSSLVSRTHINTHTQCTDVSYIRFAFLIDQLCFHMLSHRIAAAIRWPRTPSAILSDDIFCVQIPSRYLELLVPGRRLC